MTSTEKAWREGIGSLLIDARSVAGMLGRSVSSIFRDDRAGRIPRPVGIGGSKRWRRKEIQVWVDSGCPDRATWESRFPQTISATGLEALRPRT
jgi:predicted DNA-binding transcriptional regulator AlpA